MKKLFLLLLITISTFGQVGINTSNPQAILDIYSTESGILVPRLTTEQKNAIVNPAISMLIFDSNLNEYNYFDGVEWVGFKSKNNYSLQETRTNDIWIDGKAVYKKIIDLSSNISSLNSGYLVPYAITGDLSNIYSLILSLSLLYKLRSHLRLRQVQN